jgi:hypothetical protein
MCAWYRSPQRLELRRARIARSLFESTFLTDVQVSDGSDGLPEMSTEHLLDSGERRGRVPFEATDRLSPIALDGQRQTLVRRVTRFSTPSPLRTNVVPDGLSTRGGHTATIVSLDLRCSLRICIDPPRSMLATS